MMRSYDKIYLEHASVNIGTMFQYAVSCEYDPKMFNLPNQESDHQFAPG